MKLYLSVALLVLGFHFDLVWAMDAAGVQAELAIDAFAQESRKVTNAMAVVSATEKSISAVSKSCTGWHKKLSDVAMKSSGDWQTRNSPVVEKAKKRWEKHLAQLRAFEARDKASPTGYSRNNVTNGPSIAEQADANLAAKTDAAAEQLIDSLRRLKTHERLEECKHFMSRVSGKELDIENLNPQAYSYLETTRD